MGGKSVSRGRAFRQDSCPDEKESTSMSTPAARPVDPASPPHRGPGKSSAPSWPALGTPPLRGGESRRARARDPASREIFQGYERLDPTRSRRLGRLFHQVVSPSQQCLCYLRVTTRVGSHADMFRTEPIEIVGDIFAVHGPFEQLKHLWNIIFVLVPSLRDASNSDGVPPVVKHFIDSTKEFFVLWRKVHCVIRGQLLTMSAIGWAWTLLMPLWRGSPLAEMGLLVVVDLDTKLVHCRPWNQ